MKDRPSNPGIEPPKGSRSSVRLAAAWGYDVDVEITLTPRNWAKVQAGQPFSLRGKGYDHEGQFFWDYWDFSGGPAGELIVRYGSPKDGDYSAQGWVGTVKEALCESEPKAQ